MRGLEGKVKVDDELMIGLFEYICFDDGIFELLLEYKIFLFKCFEGI